MIAAIHYVVKVNLYRHPNDHNLLNQKITEIDFIHDEKLFTNDKPIKARENAFRYYEGYIENLLAHLNEDAHEDDKTVRTLLKPYYDAGLKLSNTFNHELEASLFNGIGIYLVIDKQIEGVEEWEKEKIGNELLLHGIGGPMFSDDWIFIYSLSNEYKYYKYFNYDTKNMEINVRYYDSAEEDIDNYTILKTPFDWTGYDVIPTKNLLGDNLTLHQLLKEGEGNQIEFKSSLLYHFLNHNAAIGVKAKIAKTICAFLNSNGGYLCIGVREEEDGTLILQGLEYDFSLAGNKDHKDFFELEFDEMLKHFFSLAVKSLVVGGYEWLEGKIFYKVKVLPSLEPVFMKGQHEKEFYVRGMRSTHKLNVEEFYQYYKSHWKV